MGNDTPRYAPIATDAAQRAASCISAMTTVGGGGDALAILQPKQLAVGAY